MQRLMSGVKCPECRRWLCQCEEVVTRGSQPSGAGPRDLRQIPPAEMTWWPLNGGLFTYPLVCVSAPNRTEADQIAGPENVYWSYTELQAATLDSITAQSKLGIFGRPDLLLEMMRGD